MRRSAGFRFTHAVFPTIIFQMATLGKSVLDAGKLQQLLTNRYWAHKNDLAVFSPGTVRSDDLFTEDGIGHAFLVRSTDARTLGFTGMTRDGTYRKSAKSSHPVVERWRIGTQGAR